MVAYALGATRSAGAWRWPVWAVAISVSAVSLYALSAALLARYH